MTFGSLFAGIGGMDLGLGRAGMTCKWQVEIDPKPRKVLDEQFPGIFRHDDATTFPPGDAGEFYVDLICGGDPCPFRSLARSIHGTESPDLWPTFLRIVSELQPIWVLREHVVASDVEDCSSKLSHLGYDVVILETDGSQVTGQSRSREYICGVRRTSGICPARIFHEPVGARRDTQAMRKTTPIGQCLTTHPRRFDSRDNYILEPGRGTRILSPVERERLRGFPDGWTSGLSDRQRARVIGNSLIPAFPEWIGRRILEFDGTVTR